MNLRSQVKALEKELKNLREQVHREQAEDYAGQLEFVRNRIQRLENEVLPQMRKAVERNRTLIWSYGIGLVLTLLAMLAKLVF